MKTLPLSVVALPAFAALLALSGCAKTTAPAAGPDATAATAEPLPSGATATFTEADTGKTAHIGLGETVIIRLAVNESTGNRWFLRDRLDGGVVFKKGNTTYTSAAVGSVATLVYQGGKAGTQELHFYYAPPDARQNVAKEANYRVVVR